MQLHLDVDAGKGRIRRIWKRQATSSSASAAVILLERGLFEAFGLIEA